MNRPMRVIGLLIHVAVAGMMLIAGLGKTFGFAPPEIITKMNAIGFGDKLVLIGMGETISAVLLLIPRTLSLGTLLVSGFWGGVICVHLGRHEPITIWAGMLIVTWLGAWLRLPATFASLYASPTLPSRAL